ncbi:MAG: hypothetical protein U0790_21590 [Isosphaeraceae bacterium]
MATFRQIQANRQNASGPPGRSPTRARRAFQRNRVVHGLAGEGVVLSRGDEAVVAERLASWRAGYELATPEDEWTFEQMVVNAVRVDACRARESALTNYESARAAVAWDDDRWADAEAVGARISKSPAAVVGRLEATAAGCRWLIGRWDDLSRSEEWSDVQYSLAFDLLGVPPDARDRDPWDLAGCDSPAALAESQRPARGEAGRRAGRPGRGRAVAGRAGGPGPAEPRDVAPPPLRIRLPPPLRGGPRPA